MAHERFFYSQEVDRERGRVLLPPEETHHLTRVMRMGVGDRIHVSDQRGDMYVCRIESIGEGRAECSIEEMHEFWGEDRLHMHLAAGIIRESHWEWMIEKAVELGAREITPLITQHVIRKTLRMERSEKIILAAAKQSGRGFLPILNPVCPWEKFVEEQAADHRILLDNQGAWPSLGSLLPFRGKDLILALGPEGGFSKQEVDFALKKGYFSATLGVRRLRTETAAAAALAMSPLP